MIWALARVPLCAWLNRFRGGGWGGQLVRGAQDFWVAPPMGIIAYFSNIHIWWSISWIGPVWSAILFALCWLAWSTPAWGTIYYLGFIPPPDRPGEWYERLFIRMAQGNLTGAFWLRMTICLIPMAIVFGPWWLLLGSALTIAYYLGWTINPLNGIPWCEPIAGAVWGVAFWSFA